MPLESQPDSIRKPPEGRSEPGSHETSTAYYRKSMQRITSHPEVIEEHQGEFCLMHGSKILGFGEQAALLQQAQKAGIPLEETHLFYVQQDEGEQEYQVDPEKE